MEDSAQSLRLTRLSGKRDMSTLLSQSAFSVQSCLSNTSLIVRDKSLALEHVVEALSLHRVERHTYHEHLALPRPLLFASNRQDVSSILHAVFWPGRLDDTKPLNLQVDL